MSSEPTSSPLLKLPLELLVRVQCFLSPTDILVVRKCCKKLHAASLERTLWQHVVVSLCLAYATPATAYPVQSMSLRDLEYVATCPYRFAKALQTELSDDNALPPMATRVLSLSARNHPLPLTSYHLLCLFGGRMLVTVTDSLIQLWDLGYSFAPTIAPTPLASIDADPDCCYNVCFTTLDDSDHILFVTCSEPSDTNSSTCFNLYDLSPYSPTPDIKKLASFQYASAVEYISLDAISTYLIIWNSDDTVVLCNWSDDTWTNWFIDGLGAPIEACIIVNNVIIFSGSDILIYDMPALVHRIPGHNPSTVRSQQSPIIRVSVQRDHRFAFFDSIVLGPSWPFLSVRKTEDAAGQKVPVTSWTMEPIVPVNPRATGFPAALPVKTHEFEVMERPSGRTYYAQPFLDANMLLFIRGSDLRLAFPNNFNATTEGVLYRDAADDGPSLHCFCPRSGRLCILSDDGKEIRVIDYVSAPSQ
ncbi:hypothetical protein C8J56DRAFT_920820 [Mycena floridula]|nr:hypothetical protein C8J56DRAFT_920820 [Mycena floridula]